MHPEDTEARDKFLFTLKWLLAVIKRHSGSVQFGLAHIDYKSSRILGETYGAQNASQRLDEVAHSLRKAFRNTDLVARDGVDFWILVPFTPTEEKFVDKIRYIIDTVSQCGLQIVTRDISFFSLPLDGEGLNEDYSSLEILSYLKKNRISLAHSEISLPASDYSI
ncbi:MAG: diguanylate cyclase [Gallionella sp.]|nr:diguanylate cyclase [Gallionella sp.]